jgi:hypothetical protein
LDCEIVDSSGADATSKFVFSIGEYIYSDTTGTYHPRSGLIEFENTDNGFKVANTSYTKDTFKEDSKLYLCIKPKSGTAITNSYYIKKIALYKKVLDESGKIIVPDYDQKSSNAAANFSKNAVLNNTYNYFPRWIIDSGIIADKDSIPLQTKNSLTYDTYVPIYNEGAEKIRTVSVKESNYFNNLQTIAERFEQWLTFDIGRDNNGAINSKKIRFKNYYSSDNYACFRYGVNLKDIQRTFSSKNIVTKLLVKTNSNEHAKDGFCTI